MTPTACKICMCSFHHRSSFNFGPPTCFASIVTEGHYMLCSMEDFFVKIK